jgi:hypothetical protein
LLGAAAAVGPDDGDDELTPAPLPLALALALAALAFFFFLCLEEAPPVPPASPRRAKALKELAIFGLRALSRSGGEREEGRDLEREVSEGAGVFWCRSSFAVAL